MHSNEKGMRQRRGHSQNNQNVIAMKKQGGEWAAYEPIVKVDDVSLFCPTSVDDPIMSIKRRAVAGPGQNTRFRTRVVRQTFELEQFRVRTTVRIHSFPFPNLFPRALIHGVVNSHDVAHVALAGAVPFPAHRVVKHLRGRVGPCVRALELMGGFIVAFRYGRHDTLDGQWGLLPRCWALV